MGKPKHYLDIRIEFKEVTDEDDPDYTYFRPTKAYPHKSTVSDEDLDSVAETWAQVDHYQLISPELIVNALCQTETDLNW